MPAKPLKIVVHHAGAGILARKRGSLALRLCATRAEAETAGLSKKAAARMFPRGGKELCEIEWALRPSQPLGEFEWTVSCIDKGCSGSEPDAESCECVVESCAEDATGKFTDFRSEKKRTVFVEEGRWYRCACSCTYSD